MARPLHVDQETTIPAAELELSFARSSGPGGQNVNKVNTKAVLRWKVADSQAIYGSVKARFLRMHASRVNQAGEIVLSADTHREQLRNVSTCYEKLRQLILAAKTPPKRRRKTKPSRASIERRLAEKKKRSDRKKDRRFRPE
ncbi:MAG: alternative ribosome rescue aminoacyl-tRNA hydrolase ArfB [Lacipirellulaceae bacterium]